MSIQLADLIPIGLLAAGFLFLLVAALGLTRFQDLYMRLHVTGIVDSIGAPLIFLAAAAHTGLSWTSAKLVLAIGILYLTSPLVGHMLGRAAVEAGIPLPPEKDKDAGGAP